MTWLRDYLLEPAPPGPDVRRADQVAEPTHLAAGPTHLAGGPKGPPRAVVPTARAALSRWLAPRATTVPAAATAVAPTAAVVGAGSEATAFGAALALLLARRHGSPSAVLCLAGTGLPAWHVPAVPAARRGCAALRARGLPAQASGRLVVVAVGAEPSAAAVGTGRALAAAGAGSAAVLVLAGPRDPAFDALLSHVDLAVAAIPAAAPTSLAALALAGLEAAAPRAVRAPAPVAGLGRALASAGVMVTPAIRRAILDAYELLS